jgi:uncharacterized damage-inducible protein DinB
MTTTAQIAKHLRDIHFGGNWTTSCLKDQLADINWQQATTQVHAMNTIATLVCHMHYYVAAALKVLQGGPLDAHDKFSFDLPPITCEQDWQQLQQQVWDDAHAFATLIEQLPDSILLQPFTNEKYGTYYRNLAGIIEHMHYHLGQLVIIKKLL